jgi:hypothetical protein
MTPDPAEKPLTYSQLQVLKAIVRNEVFMTLTKLGTWYQGEGAYSHVVTSSMRALITRGLVRPDQAFTGARRGVRLTAAGYAALSRAMRHPPTKKRS